MVEQQNVMEIIAENSEKLDLLEKTLALEDRQKKRILEHNIQKQKEAELNNQSKLYDGDCATSLLDQEEAIRKELVDTMIQTSTPSTGPIVKVLTNVQGKKTFFNFQCLFFLFYLFSI